MIGAWRYIPNTLLNQVSSHEGILDKAICNLIFSNGKDLYGSVEEKIVSELDGKRVDVGLINQTKAILKGKTVWDEDEKAEKK